MGDLIPHTSLRIHGETEGLPVNLDGWGNVYIRCTHSTAIFSGCDVLNRRICLNRRILPYG